MIWGLFGTKKSVLPPPPKNQIEVVCPSCGAAQYEPRLVVSTFCRSCGVHLTIQKKKVLASPVTRSGAVGVDDLWEDPSPAPAASPPASKPASAPSAKPPAKPPKPQNQAVLPDTIEIDEEGGQMGFGLLMKLVGAPLPAKQSATAEATSPEEKVEPPAKPAAAAVAVPAPTPPSARIPSTPAPPPATTFEKMKSQSVYRHQYFKDIECFDCHHEFKVSRSAKNTQCPHCGVSICIEDVEINQHSNLPIKTRGDVIIRKRGHVSATVIECRNLQCQGLVEANIHCQNEAIFKTEGVIIGEVHCGKLVIEKGAKITFLNLVQADQMHINAQVTGALNANGRIVIGPYGAVNGDVTAGAVSIEPGGELNGAMNIVRQVASHASS